MVRCLSSVLECDDPNFEVVLVDQSARPPEHPLVRDARVRWLHRPQLVGKSRALNEALAHAAGDVLAFTDDDCTVSPSWLRRAREVLQVEPDVALVFGTLSAVEHDPQQAFVPQFEPAAFTRLDGRSAFRRSGTRAGANMIARREALNRVGPFDEQIGPGTELLSLEEFDLLYRALRTGQAVILDPESTVVHWGARAYADGSARRLMRGYYLGEGAVFAKHLRCGDIELLYDIVFVTGRELFSSALNLVRRGRPTGIGRLVSFWRGFAAGLRRPLDRRHRLYKA